MRDDDMSPHYTPQTAADADESKVVGDDGEKIVISSGDPALAGIIASLLNAYGRRKDFEAGRTRGLTVRSDILTQEVGDEHAQGPHRMLAAADEAEEVVAEHRLVLDFLMGMLISPTKTPGLPRISSLSGRFEEHAHEIPAGASPWYRDADQAVRTLLAHYTVNGESYARFARDMREHAREEFALLEQPEGEEGQVLL